MRYSLDVFDDHHSVAQAAFEAAVRELSRQAHLSAPDVSRDPAQRLMMARKPTPLREYLSHARQGPLPRPGRGAGPAIDKAMEEFRIEPARRFRPIAEPVE